MKKISIVSVVIWSLMCGLIAFSLQEGERLKTRLLNEQAVSRLEHANVLATDRLQTQLEDSTAAMKAAVALLEETEPEELFSLETLTTLHALLDGYGFANVALCDTQGNAFDGNGGSVQIAEDTYYVRALLGDTTISYQRFMEGESRTVVFHMPVTGADGTVCGVLCTAWKTGKIDSLLSTTEFRGREDVLVINQNAATVLSLSGAFTEVSVLSLWGEKDDAYLNMEQVIKQGRTKTELVTDENGTQTYLSYKGIRKMNDWGVATVIAKSELDPLLTESYGSSAEIVPAAIAFACSVVLLFCLLFQAKIRYRLERMANIDHITKSYNFKGFASRMNRAFVKDASAKYAFLEVTLDKMDYFVETFGNEETNKTLAYMAGVIGKFIHADEAYCRYNTLNFILLLKYQSEEELKERILYLKEQIASKADTSRVNDKFAYHLIVGVYCIEQKDSSVDEMIRCANTAMLAAQTNHMAPFEFYKSTMENSKTESKELEEHMYDALVEKEFVVYLQPKFSLKTGKQVGAEALVRWMHPVKGLLYPGRFISLFEKNGFIVELDMYILEELCRRLRVWIRKGIKPMPLSFNVSMHNLFNGEFVGKVVDMIHKYGIPANLIMLEISEEAIAGNLELTQEIIDELKEEGFLVSMDDFGKSATSMNTLYQLHVDEVKVDRKFLLEMEKNERGQSILNSIVDTSKRFDISIVAEGVDNKAQAQLLRELGCDMMQGFVFSEPLPEREYEEYAYGARASENRISI